MSESAVAGVEVNVGALDMMVRFLLSMALFALAAVLPGEWRWVAVLGFVPLVTAALRFCPLWAALGICTCAEQRRLRAARLAH